MVQYVELWEGRERKTHVVNDEDERRILKETFEQNVKLLLTVKKKLNEVAAAEGVTVTTEETIAVFNTLARHVFFNMENFVKSTVNPATKPAGGGWE